jgi:hypothetical protein
MSRMSPRLLGGVFGCALALALLLGGCEQRPGDTDPPPTTPGQRDPDSPPPRQPLGERNGATQRDHVAALVVFDSVRT